MLNKVVSLLKESQNIAIYTHINIDCDAMGSSLAVREALISLGKNVDVYANSNFPSNFAFYGDLSFVNKKSIEGKYDLALCVDSASESRLGKYKYTYRKGVKNTVCIDHHISNEGYCKCNYIRAASSTAEILFDVISALGVRFTEKMCKFLLSGIITDTGRFSHSANSKTFTIVSKLIKFGKIKMEEVSEPILQSMEMEEFKLLQRAYQKIEFYADKKLAIIMFSRKDFGETGTTLENTDAFPDLPLQLASVQFAILASEDDQGYFRISFRSKGEISARDVAESFGGGGHLNASGCKIFGSFDEVKDRLLNNAFEVLGWKK